MFLDSYNFLNNNHFFITKYDKLFCFFHCCYAPLK
nr:MAG TPA: hypothetical protein [Caudoviricetes sp.]